METGVGRRARSALLTAAAAVVGVLLIGGCQQRAVDQAIERSSAPLLVPAGEWTDEFRFTAPPGSTDLYQMRWNFRPGRTDLVTGWQVSSSTDYDETSLTEGPGQDLIDEALRAARGEDCDTVDAALEVQLCTYPAEFARGGVNAYLVRLVQNRILVVDYVNIDGDRAEYDPDSLEARFLAADFTPVPIDGDIDEYLVTVS